MRKLTSILGTLWALTALPLILAMFLGFGHWPRLLVAATGLEVSPWYTGGAVVNTLPRAGYTVNVHRPVFDALIGERSRGFVQVDLVPDKGAALPAAIEETIEPAGDPRLAMRIRLDTGAAKATIESGGTHVVGLEGVYTLDQGFAVRVDLRNPH